MLLAVPYVEYYIFSLTGHCAIFIIDRFKVNEKKMVCEALVVLFQI